MGSRVSDASSWPASAKTRVNCSSRSTPTGSAQYPPSPKPSRDYAAAFDAHRNAPHLATFRERREREGLTDGTVEIEIFQSLTD